MDQDIEIINTNTRNEKIKNFFINYKKQLITILATIILGLFCFFFYRLLNAKITLNLLLYFRQQIF